VFRIALLSMFKSQNIFSRELEFLDPLQQPIDEPASLTLQQCITRCGFVELPEGKTSYSLSVNDGLPITVSFGNDENSKKCTVMLPPSGSTVGEILAKAFSSMQLPGKLEDYFLSCESGVALLDMSSQVERHHTEGGLIAAHMDNLFTVTLNENYLAGFREDVHPTVGSLIQAVGLPPKTPAPTPASAAPKMPAPTPAAGLPPKTPAPTPAAAALARAGPPPSMPAPTPASVAAAAAPKMPAPTPAAAGIPPKGPAPAPASMAAKTTPTVIIPSSQPVATAAAATTSPSGNNAFLNDWTNLEASLKGDVKTDAASAGVNSPTSTFSASFSKLVDTGAATEAQIEDFNKALQSIDDVLGSLQTITFQ